MDPNPHFVVTMICSGHKRKIRLPLIIRKVAASILTAILSVTDVPGVPLDKSGGGLGKSYEPGNSEGLGRPDDPVDAGVPGILYEPFDTEIVEPLRPKDGTTN